MGRSRQLISAHIRIRALVAHVLLEKAPQYELVRPPWAARVVVCTCYSKRGATPPVVPLVHHVPRLRGKITCFVEGWTRNAACINIACFCASCHSSLSVGGICSGRYGRHRGFSSVFCSLIGVDTAPPWAPSSARVRCARVHVQHMHVGVLLSRVIVEAGAHKEFKHAGYRGQDNADILHISCWLFCSSKFC